MKSIKTGKAPKAISLYSQAIKSNNFLFISGQIALDSNNNFNSYTIQERTHQIIKNINSILKKEKLKLENVVKTTVYLININNFSYVNKIYEKYFTTNKPARALMEVSALPKGALIEI